MYREPKNTPFIPNQQKELYQTKKNENPPPQNIEQNPLINLQIYDQNPPPPPKQDMNKYLASTVPSVFYPPQYSNIQQQPINVIKNYHINASGPNVDHTKLSYIYEDVLPTKNISTIPTTISERITFSNYLRSTLFSRGDGTCIDLEGTSSNSLISFIKFMDLNPYNTYKFSNNPYKGLPNGFLIYRSCYPIRHESMTNSVSCAKNSAGSNVRIYKLTNEEFNPNTSNNSIKIASDAWRDVIYYEYIKEQVIKKNESPNFVMMYGYYLNENSNIDFDKISQIKGDKTKVEDKFIKTNSQSTNSLHGNNITKPKIPLSNVEYNNKNMMKNQENITFESNPKAYTGKVLISLTESPLYNIYGWSSRIYQADGNIRRMVHSGFHSDDVWFSVLFQMMSALYTLQNHGIVFNNYNVENNIFIKDLNPHGNVTNYWKYKINGIDYYIPNYGYLVLFDSSYQDIENPVSKISNLRNFKIDSKIYDNYLSDEELNTKTFEQFKKTFNTNIFSQSFIDEGGSKPPANVIRFLEQIMNYCNNDKQQEIGEYFYRFMRKFMHNRIGTYVKEVEVNNIRINEARDFNRGDIIVHEISANTYKFALFYRSLSDGICRILTKEDNSDDIIDMDVPISVLYNYSKIEPIVQDFKSGTTHNLNEQDLLETYVINRN